jgi:hypothetical protein
VQPLPPEGRWVADAWRSAWGEVRLYGRTALAIVRGPRRFGERWGSGEGRALNPLAFAATTLGIVAALTVLLKALPGWAGASGESRSFMEELLNSGGTYLHLAALGVLAHFLIKPFRRQRALLGSIGLALYAGGIACLLTQVLQTLVLMVVPSIRSVHSLEIGQSPPWLSALFFGALTIAFAAFVRLLSASLAGLHRLAQPLAALAVLVAFVATGFVFGHVNPPGDYGLHLIFKLERTNTGSLSLRMGVASS